jgi:hypothetical protein
MDELDYIWDYVVSFVGQDTSVSITLTEESPDIETDIITQKAEKTLCELWGVKNIPTSFYVVNVDVEKIDL